MKPTVRSTLGLLGACTLAPLAAAQTAPAPERAAAPTPTAAPVASETLSAGRFSNFDGASQAVIDAVRNAQSAADAAKANLTTSTAIPPNVSRAVAQASTAIVQEGRTARADLLAERAAAIARLRATQGPAERERIISELRTQTGQRMDEQREAARLVRDRLRELRDTTSLTKP
ncbi:MAG TPA: hypothetical protein VGE76_21785 [Opitutaceae bacterium]